MSGQIIQPGQVPVGAMPYRSTATLGFLNGFWIGSILGTVWHHEFVPVTFYDSLNINLGRNVLKDVSTKGGFRGRLLSGVVSGTILGAIGATGAISNLTMEKIRMKEDIVNALPMICLAGGAGWLNGEKEESCNKSTKVATKPVLNVAAAQGSSAVSQGSSTANSAGATKKGREKGSFRGKRRLHTAARAQAPLRALQLLRIVKL